MPCCWRGASPTPTARRCLSNMPKTVGPVKRWQSGGRHEHDADTRRKKALPLWLAHR